MFKPENYFIRLLLLIMAIQGGALTTCLSLKSFTADECYELRNLSLNPITITNDGDGFPPLFRWILSISISVTGEPLARLIPMLSSLAGTWVVAMTGKRIAGGYGGLAGAVFFASSACQLEYAQQLRAYSFYILAVGCMLWVFFSLLHDWKTRHWIGLVMFTSLALLTHYFASLVALVLWSTLVVLVVQRQIPRSGERRPEGRSIARLLLAAGACVLLGVPFLYSLKIDMAHPPPAEVVNPVDFTSIAYLYLSLAQGWCVGPSSIELQSLPFKTALTQIAPWAILSFGASACLLLVALRSRRSIEIRVLLGLLTIPTLIAIMLSHWLGFSFVSRYLACLVVPVALVVSVAFSQSRNPVAHVGLAILLILNGLSFYNRNWNSRYDRENYRAIVDMISQSDESPCVLVLSHYLSHALRKEAPKHWVIVPVHFYSDDPPDSELSDLQRDPDRFSNAWVIAEWFPLNSQLSEKREQELARLHAIPYSRVCPNMDLFQIKEINPEHQSKP